MLKFYRFVLPCAALLVFSACETFPQQSSAPPETSISSVSTPAVAPASATVARLDADGWNLAVLDTARNVEYLTEMEKDVILEMNKARTDPKKFAELYIKPLYRFYSGRNYSENPSLIRITNEGVAAARECYEALQRVPAVGVLRPERALHLAALDHARDQSRSGATGHDGRDGSNPRIRSTRYGTGPLVGENIAYGSKDGHKIVVDLLIDDGVPSRSHFANIMRPEFTQAGLSIGTHPEYRTICVIVYAKDFVAK